jgi:phosphoribosyl-AMP cyclohydrolase
LTGEVIIAGQGDSITQLGGDTGNPSNDILGETNGFLACLRRELNARMGLASLDGGQWLPADAVVSDSRVANGGGATALAQYCPYTAYRDGSNVTQNRKAVTLQGAGQSVTYTVTGRYLKVMLWENNANGYNGTFSYQIDGGSVNNVTGLVVTDTYRIVTIDLGTQAAHTVVLLWVSSKVLIAGALVTNGRGVITARFGVGGTTTQDWIGRQEKEFRTTFQTLPAALQIIRFSYNDWQKQATGGQLTTPELFKTNLQTLIALALANPATKAVLLMVDPATSTADNLARTYAEYDAVAKSLATGSVAYFDMRAALPNWTTQNAYGFFVDFVHKTGAGYAVEARILANALLDPLLLSA